MPNTEPLVTPARFFPVCAFLNVPSHAPGERLQEGRNVTGEAFRYYLHVSIPQVANVAHYRESGSNLLSCVAKTHSLYSPGVVDPLANDAGFTLRGPASVAHTIVSSRDRATTDKWPRA